MARHRAFNQPPVTSEPITFDLAGVYQEPNPDWPGSPSDENPHEIPETRPVSWSETFTCVPSAPVAAAEKLRGSMVQGLDGQRIFQHASVIDYVRDVLVDGDLDRFDAMLTDRKRLVQASLILDVFIWLNEEYTTRPT